MGLRHGGPCEPPGKLSLGWEGCLEWPQKDGKGHVSPTPVLGSVPCSPGRGPTVGSCGSCPHQ